MIQHLIYVTKLCEPIAELNTRRLELYSESSWQVALQLLRTLMLTLTAGRVCGNEAQSEVKERVGR